VSGSSSCPCTTPLPYPWPTAGNGGRSTEDQVNGFFDSRINQKFGYFRSFAKKPLGFFEISPQSTKFQEDPWFFKIIPDIALATSRNYK
jgi:hypothetical protein